MARPKRTNFEHERDLAKTCELYLKGKTQQEIADELGVSRSQIEYDLNQIRHRWSTQTVYNLDQYKAKELAKLDALEREHWQAWEASEDDPRFLDGVLKCIERRAKLLGLDGPAKVSVDWRHEAEAQGVEPNALFQELAEILTGAFGEGES